ncbi:MAG: hypothetical protein RIQ79_2365 [Verrucomicrobiota bacterium]
MSPALKPCIWLYFLLLVLEGALRKWILPGLAEPLLIVRDPVVLMIYALAFASGHFPFRPAILALVAFAVISLGFALVTGTPPVVALYGLRINYLHVPLIFVMAQTLTHADVLRIGRVALWLTLGITALMLLQYQASPNSALNKGIGGGESGQLGGALGKIRPPGPFSFITGPMAWFPLATAFVMYGWTNRGAFSRRLLIAATAAIVIAVPISISRSLLFAVLIVVVFGLLTVARDVRRFGAVLFPLVLVLGLFQFAANQELTAAFSSRWENSTVAGGGIGSTIVRRFFSDFLTAFNILSEAPALGHGIGLGSNVGARYTSGEVAFLLAEGEWPKILLELGPMLGLCFILYRCWLALHVIWNAWRGLIHTGDSLGWILSGACILLVLNGQWAPPTILGFAVFGAGLALAAAPGREDTEDEDTDQANESDGQEIDTR